MLSHLAERALEIDGLRGRPDDLVGLAADDRLDRPEQAGLSAVRLEEIPDEERGRRLAVRPGDPDDLQVLRRIAVEVGRGRRHRCADVVDDDLRDAEVQRVIDDERDGALGDRLRGEVVAVTGEAADAEEQGSG